MPPRTADREMESPAAIAAIDDLLAAVGIQHGTRKTLRPGAEKRRQPPVQRRAAPSVASQTKVAPLQIPAWQDKYSWLLHGFSTRFGGVSSVYQPGSRSRDLNLGFTVSDDRANVEENRERLIGAVVGDKGRNTATLVMLTQIHC